MFSANDPPELSTIQSTTDSEAQTDVTGKLPRFCIETFTDNDVHIYTGLDCIDKFYMVLNTLGGVVYHLIYFLGRKPPLSIPNQFLLTLIKLRTHYTHVQLANLFGVLEEHVTNVFITWINLLYHQWSEVKWWADRETVKYYSPSGFKTEFPTTRVIIDGTEIPVKKPGKPLAQQATFSTYKNRNTLKVLVGISPGGLVTYVSDVYGGSTSDRQIVERSSLNQMCDAGDSIMSDKGFNVEDLFIPYQIQINIPTFFKKKNRICQKTIRKDRRISSKRVHIERVIGLAKTYAILQQPFNPTEASLANEIISVVFWLCNFRNCIVPK